MSSDYCHSDDPQKDYTHWENNRKEIVFAYHALKFKPKNAAQ